MPTYIRKRIKILPWVYLNINKTGVSLSIGPRGAKLNIGKKGAYVNSGIPGTGIYNKTKVGTSLLWGLGVAAGMIAIGYGLGILLQNFSLFVTMSISGIVLGIIAFIVARKWGNSNANAYEEEELPATTKKRTTTTKKSSSAGKRTANSQAKPRSSTPKRTENASAKAYIAEVEDLLEKMAEATTAEEIEGYYREINDIMYTNIKPLGVKVMGMDFDDAISAINKEYTSGINQVNAG